MTDPLKQKETLLLHMSLNPRRTRQNFELFYKLMKSAIELAPSEVRFTCPQIEGLAKALQDIADTPPVTETEIAINRVALETLVKFRGEQ